MTENIVGSFNLARATTEQICAIKSEYNISASASFLREVGLCLATEGIETNEAILKFFDAIYLASTSRFENTDVSVASYEDEANRTLRDAISKYKYSYNTTTDKIPLEDLLHISSKYLSTVGIDAPSTVCITDDEHNISIEDENGNNMLSATLDDSLPLLFGYVNNNESKKTETLLAQKGDAFFLLIPTDKSEDYKSQINELLQNTDFIDSVKVKSEIGCGGLLYEISHLCVGATIYADAADCNKDLTQLVTNHEGKLLVLSCAENEEVINTLAKEYSLCAIRVAVASDLLSFVIIEEDKKINIRANFLRGLFKYRRTLNESLPLDEFKLEKYEKLYAICDEKREDICGVISHKGHLISTLKTDNCSFSSAVNIVLDCIFSLIAKGVCRENIGITLKIGCNKNHKEDAISALLGIYRVCIELSIPEKDSVIIDSDQSYIFCSAYAKEPLIKAPEEKNDEPRSVYLLSFGRFNDTTPAFMPNFSELRKACMLLENSFALGKAIDAIALNGPVVSAARKLCSSPLSLSPYLEDGINENTKAQGFIVRLPLKEKIKAPMIGVIRKG